MTDETAFASLQDKPDAEHENDKNAAPNNFNSLEGSNKMTEETAFASLQDEKDTEHENDKNAAPNDFATLEGPSSLESSEVNMCTDTSQISEHVRIGFVDEKSANDYFEVGRIRNCLRNRIFLILLAAVLVVAVTVFVAVFFNITGKNDLQESPGKLSCLRVTDSLAQFHSYA